MYLGLDDLSSDDKSMRLPLANCAVHGPFFTGFSADMTSIIFKTKRALRALVINLLIIYNCDEKANLKVNFIFESNILFYTTICQ
jgi:hypothetical protein